MSDRSTRQPNGPTTPDQTTVLQHPSTDPVAYGVPNTSFSLEGLLRSIVRNELKAALREFVEPQLRDINAKVDTLLQAVKPSLGHDTFVSLDKAAKMVDVRPATIRDWIKRGYLTRYRSGRLLRVKVSELHEFLAREADNPVAALDLDAYVDQVLDRLMKRRTHKLADVLSRTTRIGNKQHGLGLSTWKQAVV